MRKNTLLALLALGTVGLTACSTHDTRRETYDMIREQLKAEMAAQAKTNNANNEAVAAALLPPITSSVPAPRPPHEERFSLALNNVNAQQFFNAVVAGTRYNMLVHPEVSGNLSANLKDVTLFEALDAIREVYGYDYKVEGNRIYIKPLTMQTRVFQVNYLTGSRQGSSDLRVTAGAITDVVTNNNGNSNSNTTTNTASGSNNNGSNSRTLESSRVTTNQASDFWAELKQTLEAIVRSRGEGRSVVLSPQSGVVVVRAMPDELRSVDEYLKATKIAVERQVILEAKILEVQLSDNYQSGINWSTFASFSGKTDNRLSAGVITPGATIAPLPYTGGKPDAMTSAGNTALNAISGYQLAAPATAAGSMFGLAFQTSNFAALISFLESQGSVHVISSPRIATMNNQKAVLKIGTDEFFVTGITSNTTTSANNSTVNSPSVTLQPFFSGVVLDVTPQIDEHGNIILHVHPSVNQVATVNKVLKLGTGGTFTLPLASSSTSETDSVVRGQDGQIVAIGGLMRQATISEKSQLPGTGDVPILSTVTGNKAQTTVKRELVILLKPTIVLGNEASNNMMSQSLQRIEQQLAPRSK
ncbi:MAG: secretin N-terminal domain-containing protein [Burkholderiales bacterium]|nr:secretin N-terminal domain-containing protein [Burkholderiales bacterium]